MSDRDAKNWMSGFRGKVDGKKITATAVFQLEKNPNIFSRNGSEL